MDEQGLTVVLSPVQLAAVLSGHAITDGEILSNRLSGGVKVLCGSLEMVGAAALLKLQVYQGKPYYILTSFPTT